MSKSEIVRLILGVPNHTAKQKIYEIKGEIFSFVGWRNVEKYWRWNKKMIVIYLPTWLWKLLWHPVTWSSTTHGASRPGPVTMGPGPVTPAQGWPTGMLRHKKGGDRAKPGHGDRWVLEFSFIPSWSSFYIDWVTEIVAKYHNR